MRSERMNEEQMVMQDALAPKDKSVPDGWKLVPIELSHKQKQDMVWAYEEAMGGSRLPDGDGNDFEVVQKMHEAMLAAAPPPPTDDERVRELESKYNELIMAVACKFPDETRHDTALRYIRNAEASAIASMPDNGGE
jgi:hypothetical protein